MQSILFDFDGVLNTVEFFSTRYSQAFGVNNELIMQFIKGDFQESILGNADLADMIDKNKDLIKWDKSSQELIDFYIKDSICLNEDLVELIRKLKDKGIKFYIATNQEKNALAYIRQNPFVQESIEKVFASCEIHAKKPQKEYYQAIFAQLQIQLQLESEASLFKPQELLYFDDEEKNVAAALELGIDARLYKEGMELEGSLVL